jgi:hypothetical protein
MRLVKLHGRDVRGPGVLAVLSLLAVMLASASPAAAAPGQPARAGARGTVAADPQPAAYVFWAGTDKDLWQAQGPANGSLAGPFNRGMGPLGSAPAAGVGASPAGNFE